MKIVFTIVMGLIHFAFGAYYTPEEEAVILNQELKMLGEIDERKLQAPREIKVEAIEQELEAKYFKENSFSETTEPGENRPKRR